MSFKCWKQKKTPPTLFSKYHCPLPQSDRKGMGEKYTEQRVSFFKAEKTQNVKIWNHHRPNPKKNSFQLQQVSSLEMNLLKNIFSLQIHTPAAMNSIPLILSSKSHFWKETVSETAYFTFSGPQQEEWLRANCPYLWTKSNVLSSSSHEWQLSCWSMNPCQSNSPLTVSYLLLLYLLCLFNTYNSRKKLILFVTTAKKKTQNPKTKPEETGFIFFKPEQKVPNANILLRWYCM